MISLSDSASSSSSSHSDGSCTDSDTSSEISAQIYSPITSDASFEFNDDDEEIAISEAIDLTPTQSTCISCTDWLLSIGQYESGLPVNQLSAPPHVATQKVGFKLVGDNIDKSIKARYYAF